MQGLFDRLAQESCSAALLWSAVISARLERISVPTRTNGDVFWQALSSPVLTGCAQHWQGRIDTLDLLVPGVDDSFIIALSNSAIAQNLRRIRLKDALITPASSHAWYRFLSLEEFAIEKAPLLGNESLDIIVSIDSLRSLELIGTNNELIPTFQALIDRKKNNLTSIRYEPEESEQMRPLGFLDLFTQWPGRLNLERLQLVTLWNCYGEQDVVLQKLCPKATHFLQEVNINLGGQDEDNPPIPLEQYAHLAEVELIQIDPLLEKVASSFTNLEKLTLWTPGAISLGSLQRMTTLRHLSLRGIQKSFTDFINEDDNNLYWPDSLVSLNLQFQPGFVVPLSPVFNSLCALTNLTSLRLTPLPRITSTMLQRLLASLPLLEELDIDPDGGALDCENLTLIHSNLKSIDCFIRDSCSLSGAVLPRLESLHFGTAVEIADFISDFTADKKPHIPSLEFITLSLFGGEDERAFEAALEALATLCPRLERFIISSGTDRSGR